MRRPRPVIPEYDEQETALIWNPHFGFRLEAPARDGPCVLSLPETFLTVLSFNIDEELMHRITRECLTHFRKH
jgi:hypothetical protein